MALKKVNLSKTELEIATKLFLQGESTLKISKKLNINQTKVWRNLQCIGLISQPKNKVNNSEYFNWEDYDNCVI